MKSPRVCYLGLCLLFLFLFTSCEKCEEPEEIIYPPLTQSEKAIIPHRTGDSLHFEESTGSKYYLVCTKKELEKNGYSNIGSRNPCEHTRVIWEKLTATYSGNLFDDQGIPITISTALQPNSNPGDLGKYTSTCSRSPGHFFNLVINSVTFYGFVNHETIPRINNFNFRSTLKLNGKLYSNINYSGVTPDQQTNCPAPANKNATIDSIYYSTQFGIIRITTVGGRKYQRVL